MNKRWLNNFIAVCFVFLVLTMFLLLGGCASTKLTYDPKGTTTWESWTFLKDVKDAQVQWGPFYARLGSSIGNDTVIPSALTASAQATGQIWLMGGPLYDMTGRPRAATAAEMAAQYEALNEPGLN